MKKIMTIWSVFLVGLSLWGCMTTSPEQTTSLPTTLPSSSSVTTSLTNSTTTSIPSSVTTTTSPTTISKTDQQILQEFVLTIEVPSSTEEDIELPTQFMYLDQVIQASWHSTASAVITPQGVITRTVSDQKATLILTLSLRNALVQRNFEITIKSNPAFLVLFAVANSQVSFPNRVLVDNLVLPSFYEIEGLIVDASWSSSDESVLSSQGVVTLGNSERAVTLTLTLSYGGAQRIENYAFTIAINPAVLPENWWHTVSVYTGAIQNESIKPATPSCFQGAIYRKVVSSRDMWLGIEALITLPVFTVDSQRFDSTKANYFLDNASIYMGGNAYAESDVGIAWMMGYPSRLASSFSRGGIAYRPFWRYITSLESCTNNNCYRNANVNNFETYYFPGDTIRMSVFTPKVGYMQLRIELVSLTTHPDYVNKRSIEYGLAEDFNRVFVTPIFPSAGMGAVPAEFKRVNAIDQVANEGKPTLNTNASVIDAIWKEVYLYRRINEVLVKVPMTSSRSAYMTCPLGSNVNGNFSQAFSISSNGVDVSLGGEVISINPNNGTGKLYNLSIIWIPEDKRRFI